MCLVNNNTIEKVAKIFKILNVFLTKITFLIYLLIFNFNTYMKYS